MYGQYIVPSVDECANLGVGQPSNNNLPLDIIKKSCLEINNIEDKSLLQYGDIPGYNKFRTSLSNFLSKEYDSIVDSNNLFLTNGVTGAVSLIISLLINKTRKLYVESSSYFIMIKIFKEFGFDIDVIQLEEDGLDLDEFEEKLKNDKNETKILYTIPIFSNPSGITMCHKKRLRLIKLSDKYNVYIISDETYQLLYFDEKPLVPLFYYGNENSKIFSLGSFSKILAPSLRVGYIQCNNILINLLRNSAQLDSSGGLNPFSYRIINNIIDSGDLENYLNETRLTLKKNCDELCNNLDGLTFRKPEGGYFIWIESNFDCIAFLDYCSGKKLKFHCGNKFSSEGKLKNYFRLSFSFYNSDDLAVAGKRLSKLYNEYNKLITL